MVIGNSEGEGVSKAKLCKGKYEAKLEIPGGGGGWEDMNRRTILGEVWIFSEPHIHVQLKSENCECLKYCRT